MKILRKGSEGNSVAQWQQFLLGEFSEEEVSLNFKVDRIFGRLTEYWTKEFQRVNGLTADGIVGNDTYAQAMADGLLCAVDDETLDDIPELIDTGVEAIPTMLTHAQRTKLFGDFKYEHKPIAGNPENIIIISEGWLRKNIIFLTIPEFKEAGILTYGGKTWSGNLTVHKKIEKNIRMLAKKWKQHGIMKYVEFWGGSFVPRFIRGSRTKLSNHAWGTAFDINIQHNRLGHRPARLQEKGTVIPLVKDAVDCGFHWGGWYKFRKDGMHLEAFKAL